MELFIALAVGLFLYRAITRIGRSAPSDLPTRPPPPPPPSERQLSAPDAEWIPAGNVVDIAGHRIEGGMLYVGTGLSAIGPWRGIEPALIDPRAKVSPSSAEVTTATAGYWPSYSTISPAFRAKYLRWLADGRSAREIDLGCVFLFFYGLERRVLIDAQGSDEARLEVAGILDETIRLLGIYGENNSFRGYASSFIDLIRARHFPDTLTIALAVEEQGYQLPLGVRVAIGQLVARREPIPAELALVWLRFHPMVRLRTAAVRCPQEFDVLFRLRYEQKFGAGMTVPPNRTNVAVEYRPASASFATTYRAVLEGIPDITVLSAPLARLEKIADQVTADLDRYSRWVGRTDDRESPAALAFLPPELARERLREFDHGLLHYLRSSVTGEIPAVLATDQVLYHWSSDADGRLAKREVEALTDFVGLANFGIEPDVRFTNINFSRSPRLVVFRLIGEPEAPGSDYLHALLFLNLAVAVAGADDMAFAEEEELERHLETAFQLGPAERRRLRAHLAWLRACPPSPTTVKKQVELLPEAQRRSMGKALIVIAGADGNVSSRELGVLRKIYPILGLDPASLYTDVHTLSIGSTPAAGPVTVLSADPGIDLLIPQPEDGKTARAHVVVLDMTRVAAIREETRTVTAVLAGVFASEDDSLNETPERDEEAEGADCEDRREDSVAGLDAAHSALVLALLGKSELSRFELGRLAENLGLMAGGAIEIINEAAFELSGEPLLEGHDPIEVNPYALQEMLV